MQRFVSVPFSPQQVAFSKGLVEEAQSLEALILDVTPASREQSLALTKLEECVMWCNRAIAVAPARFPDGSPTHENPEWYRGVDQTLDHLDKENCLRREEIKESNHIVNDLLPQIDRLDRLTNHVNREIGVAEDVPLCQRLAAIDNELHVSGGGLVPSLSARVTALELALQQAAPSPAEHKLAEAICGKDFCDQQPHAPEVCDTSLEEH